MCKRLLEFDTQRERERERERERQTDRQTERQREERERERELRGPTYIVTWNTIFFCTEILDKDDEPQDQVRSQNVAYKYRFYVRKHNR